MDYPKSVPGVGLVGGKFVDENSATGQQGSLIPSAWGNAVTEEISNVIKDAGDVPVEGDLSQLQKAIRKIVALVWPKASDAEVADGVMDDKVVTPKKLRAGFAISLTANGYVAFPSWMKGLILQWGIVALPAQTAAISGVYTTKAVGTFPIPYPVGVQCIFGGLKSAGIAGAWSQCTAWVGGMSNAQFEAVIVSTFPRDAVGSNWFFAIGS